jgi:hypothetical protein
MAEIKIPEGGFWGPDFIVYFSTSESHSIADGLSAGATAASFIPGG